MMPEAVIAPVGSNGLRATDNVAVVGLLDSVAIDGLSLSELVGLLAFTPGVNLYVDDLADVQQVVSGLEFALLATSLAAREAQGALAARVLARPQAPEHEYVALVARAVTRVLGVIA